MQDLYFEPKVFGKNFLYDIHVDYLLRLLRKSTLGLPLDVAEAHRLSSLFFVISGLDLLGALGTHLTQKDRNDIIEWIYSYQVDIKKVKPKEDIIDDSKLFKDVNSPHQHQRLLDPDYHQHRAQPSPTTGQNNDGLDSRVSYSGFRATGMIDSDIPLDCGYITMTYCALATLVILGDDLSRVDRYSIIAGMRSLQQPDGSFKPSALGGECDMRLVYCAVAVSQLLNDWSGIDLDSCARFIKSSLSHEGAFAQCPGAEAHGGSTYCALASLKLMSKVDGILDAHELDRLIRWCINRLDVGFSGRPNKDQDTCYSFWIGACLVMLDHFKYLEQKNLLEFILLAQEERGGLSKTPAFYSDPLHTYLGLAGMTFIDKELCKKRGVVLLELDPTLNISKRARKYLDELHRTWKQNQ